MREWGLQSEPWTFVVGADGRVKAKFEGSVSVASSSAAVRPLLRPEDRRQSWRFAGIRSMREGAMPDDGYAKSVLVTTEWVAEHLTTMG